jgi:hypothetical protein
MPAQTSTAGADAVVGRLPALLMALLLVLLFLGVAAHAAVALSQRHSDARAVVIGPRPEWPGSVHVRRRSPLRNGSPSARRQGRQVADVIPRSPMTAR